MDDTTQTDPISHFHVALLDLEDAGRMDAVLARPELRGLIWKRLDATRALVDPGRVHTLQARLTAAGVPARLSGLRTPGLDR
jgi:hypothetical protein